MHIDQNGHVVLCPGSPQHQPFILRARFAKFPRNLPERIDEVLQCLHIMPGSHLFSNNLREAGEGMLALTWGARGEEGRLCCLERMSFIFMSTS